jgi:MoaE-MoaD fusion protein
MRIVVRLFGPEAQRLGRREVAVDAPGPVTCADLTDLLGKQHPELSANLPRCRLAVNHEFAGRDDLVREEDEVALIGQVSGG